MAETTIEWAHFTQNPWIGCSRVHAGCEHCYAESYANRYGKAIWGPSGTRVKTSDANWKKPLKWNKDAEKAGERKRVFCASLADIFEDWQGPILNHKGERIGRERPFGDGLGDVMEWGTMDDLRRDLFAMIDATPHLDWLLLTKRPENIRRMWLPIHETSHGGQSHHFIEYRHNVWLLTSVSDQKTADKYIPPLLECRDLVPVLGVSAEPLLDGANLSPYLTPSSRCGLDWVIVGGESGPKSRPCRTAWVRSIVQQCHDANVSCFVKQLGSKPLVTVFDWRDVGFSDKDFVPDCKEEPIGSYPVGVYKPRDSKGGDMRDFPADLRVRQFPVHCESTLGV